MAEFIFHIIPDCVHKFVVTVFLCIQSLMYLSLITLRPTLKLHLTSSSVLITAAHGVRDLTRVDSDLSDTGGSITFHCCILPPRFDKYCIILVRDAVRLR